MADTLIDPSASLVALRSLTRHFTSRASLFGRTRTLTAVSDVTLDITRGTVTGVVGESGWGKSTLARLVLRLLPASSGSSGLTTTVALALPDSVSSSVTLNTAV